MTTISPKTIGLLLAGGKSERMGGGDKCLRLLNGTSLLDTVIGRAMPQVDELLLNINGDTSRFPSHNLITVSDLIPSIGPLGGIHAGLSWMHTHRPTARWLMTFATDAPFFPDNIAKTLVQRAKSTKARVLLPKHLDRIQPTFGLWHISILDELTDYLKRASDFSIRRVAAQLDATLIDVQGEAHCFMNINSPEDLAMAQAIMTHQRPRH